jgi:ankyrin repeat protein
MFAAYQGHAAVVKYLLANGANVNLASEADFTALDYAVKGAELECAALLQGSGAKLGDIASVMSFVCDQGHVALAKLVLSHRPPLDALDGNGVAPLHYAAIRGHLALAELLISAGARVNTTSKSGLTPLAMAKDAQQAELVALLERQGAS